MNLKRIMISGISSSCGKTTVTAAILKNLKDRGLCVQSFKCGPDYIDPKIHSFITGTPAVNLDPFMSGEYGVTEIFQAYAQNKDICVIEGAMGYYDGISDRDTSSAYHVASLTDTPVILAINPKGMALTAAAVVKGMMAFREQSNIIGVILSDIREGMYPYYKKLFEDNDIMVFGYLPHIEESSFKSRYLGLYLADEIEGLPEKIESLGNAAEKNIEMEKILKAAKRPWKTKKIRKPDRQYNVTVGIAYDEAFSFYYEHSLKLLQNMGASIVRVSPMHDEKLPFQLDGLIVGGGYPEHYLKELSENRPFLDSLNQAASQGMPLIAECGGFMYLNRTAESDDGKVYPLANLVPGHAYMTKNLCRFGYSTITAKQNNLLLNQGESLKGHEFHYSDSTECGCDCTILKSRNRVSEGIFASDNLFAGYPHIDFYSNPKAAERFLKKCVLYKKAKGTI